MSLPEIVQDCIDRWDLVGLNSEISKEESIEWIQKNAWDLVPLLVFPATEDNLSKCPQIVHACSRILCDPVAKLGNPKEIVLALLEHCEHSGDTLKLQHCLPAIETSLLRLDLKASNAIWDWALHTIIECIVKLDMPDIQVLEGNERVALEHDESYATRIALIAETTDVLESLTKKLCSFNADASVTLKLRGSLIWSCVQMLANPLSSMNVEISAKSGVQTSAKMVSARLNTIIEKQCSNYMLINKLEDFSLNFSNAKALSEDMSEEERLVQLCQWSFGIGTLLHHNFQDNNFPFPMCYDPIFIFNTNLKVIIEMLAFERGQETCHYFRHEKALFLCQYLMQRINCENIPDDIFDAEDHFQLISKFHQVIIYHNMETVRKLAFQVYNQYFSTFGRKAKPFMAMFQFVLKKANHSGLIGHAIGKLKDKILQCMKLNTLQQSEHQEIFSKTNLHQILKKICRLSNGAETDLLEVSDEIMASLNFLICLLLRDKDNVFDLGQILPYLENDFINPIEKGLSMSRAHYKLKLEEQKNPVHPESSSEISLMVGGQTLPEMSPDQVKEVVHAAMNTFDMMECVLCQLKDVISRNKK